MRRMAQKLRKARDTICRTVLSRMIRQKFRKLVGQVVLQMKSAVTRIQRVRRRLLLHRRLMIAVNKRIAFNKQERYRKEMERQ
jgi:hypothetical protein